MILLPPSYPKTLWPKSHNIRQETPTSIPFFKILSRPKKGKRILPLNIIQVISNRIPLLNERKLMLSMRLSLINWAEHNPWQKVSTKTTLKPRGRLLWTALINKFSLCLLLRMHSWTRILRSYHPLQERKALNLGQLSSKLHFRLLRKCVLQKI